MAITDAQTRFSNVQSLVGAAATTLSTNYLDLTVVRDIGRGQDIRMKVTIDTTFAGGTSLQANLIQSANPDMSSPTVLWAGPVVADAALVAGYTYADINEPPNSQRYLAWQYVTLGTHTAGAISANLVSDTDQNRYYAANTGYN